MLPDLLADMHSERSAACTWLTSESVVRPWTALVAHDVRLCGLVFVTDHDWNREVVTEYQRQIIAQEEIRPIHVMQHDGRNHVVDGRHRTMAHLLLGRSTIIAKIQKGCTAECPCSELKL